MTEDLQAQFRTVYAQALGALRSGRAATAELQIRAIQAAAPGEVNSLRLLGAALLAQGKVREAVDSLERVVATAPDFAYARLDLARAYRQDGRLDEAREQVRRVLKAEPTLDLAWLAYGDVLVDLKQYADAPYAYEQARRHDVHRLRIEAASAALGNDRDAAETMFREILRADASHVGALCGLAAVSLVTGNTVDAERLVRHARIQTAHSPVVGRALSHTLLMAGRLIEAETAIRELLNIEADNPHNWVTLGAIYARLLRQRDAVAAYEEAARLNPSQANLRLSIGHLHKTLGQRALCEKAYKECLSLDPRFAEAYWSLADLKNYVFSEDEIAAMQSLLADATLEPDSQAQLHFALGRAFEQEKRHPAAFDHYVTGNALRRASSPFDIGAFEAKTRRIIEFFGAAFMESLQSLERANPAKKQTGEQPIFIVGLPRSGSTLVEQILASHSAVEGTMELPNILMLVKELDQLGGSDGYPESVAGASLGQLRALGVRYLDETRPIRSGRPHFIDKMPNNFSHIGLIRAILPDAVVIDVRRHPMDSCFSSFKQNFAEGQSFSYDLETLGRYYRCYLEVMDHWDRVLPGKVMQLRYEDLVASPDANIRRLLTHCSLRFEETCLKFHETQRPVRTASSEQVRQPLYASGVGYWRHFERELEPLKQSLGDCLGRFA